MGVVTVSREVLDIRQERLTARPSGRPAMHHQWLDLLFLHVPVDPRLLQRLLPPELSVDTFPDARGRESAWLGLVAFRMKGLRLRWLPPVPALSSFAEANVRTYVHRSGEEPGVWFFSLDARPRLACRIARWWYREPYTVADMYCRRDGDRVTYRASRLEGARAGCELVCQVGEPLGASQPGTLSWFLTERYQLYAGSRERVWKARVWHEPYRLREVELLRCESSMFEPLGVQTQPWEHSGFCDGVTTEVFPLQLA